MKKFAAFCFLCIVFSPVVSQAQKPVTVNGVVNDNKGLPLAGASIQVKGKNSGTTSDNDGIFRIKLQPGMFVCINAIGFRGDTIKIEDTTTRLSIVLEPRIKSLEGIVITGTDQKAVTNDPMHIMVTHSAGATLHEFLERENTFSGQTLITPYKTSPSGA
ncbi:MAG TPA: carboxypeptidase-like regulatory domain-containing protein, partial [Puia sp.]|nr:carboxypeptidase-like regulatory domain-containing protein [Puia sp.]